MEILPQSWFYFYLFTYVRTYLLIYVLAYVHTYICLYLLIYWLTQRAKKVMSDSLGLVDFPVGLVIFVVNLPNWQVLFLGEIQITTILLIKKGFGASWDDLWASTGLKITAGQWTMSGLIVDLTGQTLIFPVILTGHFWIRTFYFPYSCRLMLYNAVLISFSLAFFAALH